MCLIPITKVRVSGIMGLMSVDAKYEDAGTPIARGANINAKLITAAPEMHELLEECGNVLEAVDIEFKAYGLERADVSNLLDKVDALLRRVKQ